jgi:hypothetical protein
MAFEYPKKGKFKTALHRICTEVPQKNHGNNIAPA